MFALKRVFMPVNCCLIFCLIFIKYSHAQPNQTESSKEDMWLKEDNLALRERLKELQHTISEQNRIQLELQEELTKLQKERGSYDQLVVKGNDSLGLNAGFLNDKIAVLEKEKDILEAMLSIKTQDDLRSPGKVQAAEKSWDKIIHLNLGYAYGSQGKTKEAIREYREASKYDPQDKDIHYNLGYLFSMENRYQEAVDEYKRSLKGASEDKEVYYNLAIIYAVDLKDSNTGQEYYQKFLQLSSADRDFNSQREGLNPKE